MVVATETCFESLCTTWPSYDWSAHSGEQLCGQSVIMMRRVFFLLTSCGLSVVGSRYGIGSMSGNVVLTTDGGPRASKTQTVSSGNYNQW